MAFRPFFLLGDVLANVCVGALAGMAVSALINPAWPMFAAMAAGMVVGHLLSFVTGALAFYRYFGIMEIMLPTMITGMLAGMFVAMVASMSSVAAGTAAIVGALIGLGALFAVYAANYVINGRLPT